VPNYAGVKYFLLSKNPDTFNVFDDDMDDNLFPPSFVYFIYEIKMLVYVMAIKI